MACPDQPQLRHFRRRGKQVARAFLTRGTKVVLWRQNDFNSLNNAVYFEGSAGQECPGYLLSSASFLPGGNARPNNERTPVSAAVMNPA
jgi:hypothetical protein